MKTILTLLLQFLVFQLAAQVKVTGTVLDENNEPITGANIFIQNSYDGTTSDSLGNFTFTTDLTDEQTLVVSFVGYKTQGIQLNISGANGSEGAGGSRIMF